MDAIHAVEKNKEARSTKTPLVRAVQVDSLDGLLYPLTRCQVISFYTRGNFLSVLAVIRAYIVCALSDRWGLIER